MILDVMLIVPWSVLFCMLMRLFYFSSSLSVLQDVHHIVHVTPSDMICCLNFNVNKLYGIAFGPSAGNLLSLFVAGKTLNRHSPVKYLRVYLVFGKHLRVDFHEVKWKFYSACNCVLSKSHCTKE